MQFEKTLQNSKSERICGTNQLLSMVLLTLNLPDVLEMKAVTALGEFSFNSLEDDIS